VIGQSKFILTSSVSRYEGKGVERVGRDVVLSCADMS
jgi:hypothetical protein